MIRILSWAGGLCLLVIVAFAISWVYYMPAKALRGVWQTQGHGLLVKISTTTIKTYQHSDIHCLHDQTLPAHQGLLSLGAGVTFSQDDAGLVMDGEGPLGPVHARKISALPDMCHADMPSDAGFVFDVMWETMNAHYTQFDLHDVDWAARLLLRPATGADVNDAVLFDAMQQALTGLDDPQSFIATDTAIWSPASRPSWHDDRHMVRDTSLRAVPDLSAPSETGLRVGWAAPDIGYIQFTHLDPQTGPGQRANVVASQAMSQVLAYLSGADGIILDLRYTPGGLDQVAMAYAGFFTDRAVPLFTQTTRTKTGHRQPFTAVLTPQTATTALPVVVLTGPYTGSAAETLTFAMAALPQVTTLGMATSGGLSGQMRVTLPNGWVLGLSHQDYTSLTGDYLSGAEMTPDVSLAVDVMAAQDGQDNVLAAAIETLRD